MGTVFSLVDQVVLLSHPRKFYEKNLEIVYSNSYEQWISAGVDI